jgi:hypothetical protein
VQDDVSGVVQCLGDRLQVDVELIRPARGEYEFAVLALAGPLGGRPPADTGGYDVAEVLAPDAAPYPAWVWDPG